MKRTKQIEKFMSEIDGIRIHFEELAEKKQTSFESKSDKWQEGEKGQEMGTDISNVEEIRDKLEDIYSVIESYFEE